MCIRDSRISGCFFLLGQLSLIVPGLGIGLENHLLILGIQALKKVLVNHADSGAVYMVGLRAVFDRLIVFACRGDADGVVVSIDGSLLERREHLADEMCIRDRSPPAPPQAFSSAPL